MRKLVRQPVFVLSKSQLDSPSHFTSNLSPEAVENLKQELSSTKVTLHLDYKQSFFFLSPSSKTRETRKWPHAWLKTRDAFFFLLKRPPSFLASTLVRACTPLTKSEEKKRDCSQTTLHLFWCFVEMLFIATAESEKLLFLSVVSVCTSKFLLLNILILYASMIYR